MSSMSPIQAVCFDLDETLCVSDKSDHEFNEAVFERAGRDPLFTPDMLRSVDWSEIEPSGNITEFYTNLYRTIVRKFGLDIDPESSLLVELGEYAGEISAETGVSFRDGAESALDYASEHYAVALITNGREEIQSAKLAQLGIRDEFDATVFCDPDARISAKPAREPFRMVLSSLSVSPKACVIVGNNHAVDIVGAHRAGFRSVWTPMNRSHESLPADPSPPPTYRIDSLAELLDVLRAIDSEACGSSSASS